MNILLTFNKKYLPYCVSLIRSINAYNSVRLDFYLVTNDVKKDDLMIYQQYFTNNNFFHFVNIDEQMFKDSRTSKRYPLAIYYRLFASKYLPSDMDKILYLDPDIIVKGDLSSLYNLDLGDNYFAGATNIGLFLKKFNQLRTGANKDNIYLNTGVLLFNLKKLREEQKEEDVYEFLEKKRYLLTLPDQDVIYTLYGNKVTLIDNLIYNISDRTITLFNLKNKITKKKIDYSWVEENSIIIHYFGRNKPWKSSYKGILKPFYDRYKVIKDQEDKK